MLRLAGFAGFVLAGLAGFVAMSSMTRVLSFQAAIES